MLHVAQIICMINLRKQLTIKKTLSARGYRLVRHRPEVVHVSDLPQEVLQPRGNTEAFPHATQGKSKKGTSDD